MHLRFSKPFDNEALLWDYLRLEIAERYHWTLEYIDSLPYAEVQKMLGVWGGKIEAKSKMMRTK